ncbi:FAD/NAD-P-binding domain-containing protein [Neolentinus lepideus HHB14362 ss-1]|uniref:FAD/NAD-P-binding domain-containing protein n=1 Tax=Neolentinus lepideus HHB14362 ss-1 TaxID=1314782 RepID=A0A165W7X2_9AGAM|nr:FAD/NAD-P-binding domain-containing protein [Neolentinus lepideus HHB14362 ss-1]
MAPKQTVIIIGGGTAGTIIARELSVKLDRSKYQLILITSRPEFLFLPASLRVLVVDGYPIEDAFMPYDKLFVNGNGTVRVGTVAAIENNKEGKGGRVVLEDGDSVQWDALVLASGSTWEGPLAFPSDREQYHAHIRSWRQRFHDATHVVLAGGGSVGLEIAGELKDVYPNKKVTIVHGDEHLLNAIYPTKWRKNIGKRLRSRGVELVLNDYVEAAPESGPIVTRNGHTIQDADIVVPSRGGRSNTSFIKSLIPSPVNDRGFVKVEPTLQVQSHPGIFAVGDIMDWQEAKQFAKARSHASVVVANVLTYLEGQPAKKVYKGSPELIIITNGKNGGFAYLGLLWGLTFGDWFSRTLKSKDLMVPGVRKGLGL